MICSACAQTRGIADPEGRPRKSSRSGTSSPSQTCSGRRCPSLPHASNVRSKRPASRGSAGREFVMGALSGKERPQSADARTVERAAVIVLAIAVAVIAPPAWSGRQLYLEKRIDHRDGVADARIVRRAQPEAHQREGIGTYDRPSLLIGLAWGTILDRHKAVGWRGGFR